ncbi:hypothetical protein COCC4DRAFT_184016 [Bipolaris maydis ATCC 48331]|uniref:Uncharacterized protein n=2 Tax=Cochliobolus heterostrophus TaxID=5016 RepID=M2V8D2_COCH5|nr:uncharacterized protein COCC4DRAFT_184016 [Bipolaris maydis ATCC 48331]EMD95988.1 hypothetical protein COCHEDRAFT_1166717 [Bipolaris maydis C5]KAH7561872.1 hypothetical protein BM1_02976 [Bipolaris maydis]ENI10846.1 hypothetical protein COCC4DRAFT_184016 [Bipolaris maydis ATCC 48331]KAJ5030694.1 hypothetical protein J3E73DRAFT_205157 [Bipolaris maydis]KAJ5065709.1 hypothetical protein J3E74DRAFT_260842 [Bipolaris maydis]
MPVRYTCMGRPVTLHMPPRRFQAVFIILVFLIFNLVFYGPPSRKSIPTYDQVADAVKHPQAHVPDLGQLPSVPNPFGPSPHKPPVQANSTAASAYGAIEWLSDFKWRNPFSSSVTLDENRALLPPLRERPPIYTYYDVPKKQDKDVSAAEQRLLLAWRRAWWAQGFKPVVLSRDEAKRNPLYQIFQRLKLDPKIEFEVMRWLAWGHMKGGVLVNWLALPMAEYENPMLNFLRRNEYPKLSRVQSLDNAIFFGEQIAVNNAIKKLADNQLLKNVTANKDKLAKLANKEGGPVVNLLASADVAVDVKADGIASYSTATISSKYKTIADKLTNTTKAEALTLLESLINSHLHLTWQEQHPEGVALVKPVPEHTTALMFEATSIARNLTQCPASPMPKTCPPNRPKCKPCDANKAMKLQIFPEFVNTTKFFTIGTVPHPYTLTSLHYTRDTVDSNFLRNNAERDLWIRKLTDKSIPGDHTEEVRVLRFKELVAAIPAHSLWLTAERITQDDLDWVFGFGMPQMASTTAEPSSPSKESELIIFPRPGPPKPIQSIDIPDDKWVEKEQERLNKARDAIKSKDKNMKKIVEAVEQWNLADTEAWRFSRAYSARRRQERKKWEEEEAKYSGSEKKAGVRPGSGGGRWIDRK